MCARTTYTDEEEHTREQSARYRVQHHQQRAGHHAEEAQSHEEVRDSLLAHVYGDAYWLWVTDGLRFVPVGVCARFLHYDARFVGRERVRVDGCLGH